MTRKHLNNILAATVAVFILAVLLFSCTEQDKARAWGGTYEVQIPKGKRLVTCSWKDKDASLWFLIEDAPVGYEPQRKEYRQQKSYDWMVEGTVIFVESK